MRIKWNRGSSTGFFSGWLIFGFTGALLVSGCAAPPPASNSNDELQTPATTAQAPSAVDGLLETANAGRGRLLFLQCRACHSLEQGGDNKVGPNLYGLLGSVAGKAEGFDYSSELTNSGIVWTPQTIDQWLAKPSEFLPGNRMVFAGVADPEDRADLIAYLQQATAPAD